VEKGARYLFHKVIGAVEADLSRPKSSWAGIIGAFGALAAADGAQKAAGELRKQNAARGESLTLQQASLALLQEHIDSERRAREAEQQLKELVRKLKQELFDFSEALPSVRQGIEGFLPDLYTAAALFYERALQQRADKFCSNRELLESYEDKKLIKRVQDEVRAIRGSIDELASVAGRTLDSVIGELHARHSEIEKLRKVVLEARETVDGLMEHVSQWSEHGPSDFLDALTGLCHGRSVVQNARQALTDFAETISFIEAHPSIGQVWPRVGEVDLDSLEKLNCEITRALRETELLLGKWELQKDNFIALHDHFRSGEYDEFESRLSTCGPDLRQLREVRNWDALARERSAEVRNSLLGARGAIQKKDWKGAFRHVKSARAVRCGGALQQAVQEVDNLVWAGLLPRRLCWILGICTITGGVCYWGRVFRWFLVAVLGVAGILLTLFLVGWILNWISPTSGSKSSKA
jgi:hypothetical protein